MSSARYKADNPTSVRRAILETSNRRWLDDCIRSDGIPDVGAPTSEVHDRGGILTAEPRNSSRHTKTCSTEPPAYNAPQSTWLSDLDEIMDPIEETLVLIKPDALERGLTGEIL